MAETNVATLIPRGSVLDAIRQAESMAKGAHGIVIAMTITDEDGSPATITLWSKQTNAEVLWLAESLRNDVMTSRAAG